MSSAWVGLSIGLGHSFFCLQKLVQGKFDGRTHNTKTGNATTADAFAIAHGVGECRGEVEESSGPEGSAEERRKVAFFV
jgi:hypothetical protein